MKVLISLLLAAILVSCGGHTKKNKAEKAKEKEQSQTEVPSGGYDLNHPDQKWVLPDELFEISGQTWIDKNHLLAIEDLHPTLYLLKIDSNITIEKTSSFKDSSDKKFDLEDIAVVDNIAYALWSHGKIYKLSNWRDNPTFDKYGTGLSKDNNTEGLCFDPVTKNLLVACKFESDLENEKKSTRSIFEFDLATDKLKDNPFLLIEKSDLDKLSNEKFSFFPSAIAVHPLTHDVYILSTRDTKCMARYSHDGHALSIDFIDKDLMLQPEGICFAPDGTLYISSEGKKGEPATLFKFNYKK